MSTRATRTRQLRLALLGLTPLNELTSARYAACGGHHRRSGSWVERDIEGYTYALPVCGSCGVPYRPRRLSWTAIPNRAASIGRWGRA